VGAKGKTPSIENNGTMRQYNDERLSG